jgi:hypothetical protein
MSFLEKYSNYLHLLKEQPDDAQDASAPDPNAVPPQPEIKEEPKQVAIPPEGYVNLVRMVAKALVMDVPASEIDTILSGQDITKENALNMQKGLDAVLKDNEIKSDNPERLQNPNYKKFVESINERNFMQKYNLLLDIMKKRSPYIS